MIEDMKGGRSKAGESKAVSSRLNVKKGPAKKGKAAKDPNKPKRPPSAFFVFMEDFRVTYKQKHPNNKSVAAVGKAGGEKWKSMSDAEKAPFIAKAEKRKADYEKNMNAYNKGLAAGNTNSRDEEVDSDKSRSEVNDEDDEEGSGEDEDEED